MLAYADDAGRPPVAGSGGGVQLEARGLDDASESVCCDCVFCGYDGVILVRDDFWAPDEFRVRGAHEECARGEFCVQDENRRRDDVCAEACEEGDSDPERIDS